MQIKIPILFLELTQQLQREEHNLKKNMMHFTKWLLKLLEKKISNTHMKWENTFQQNLISKEFGNIIKSIP